MTDDFQTKVERADKTSRPHEAHGRFRWSTVLLFSGVGPPLGGAALLLYSMAAHVYGDVAAGQFGADAFAPLGFFPIVLALSYFFGGVQAFLTGLLLAAYEAASNRAIGYSAVIGAATIASLTIFLFDRDLALAGSHWALCVAAGLVVRLLFRRRFARRGD